MSGIKTNLKQLLLCLNEESYKRKITYKIERADKFDEKYHKIQTTLKLIIFYTKFPIHSQYFNYENELFIFLLAEMERYEKKEIIYYVNNETKKVEYFRKLDNV